MGLRVGFLIDRWEPGRGGAERALARLAEFLAQRDYEVHAFGVGSSGDAPGSFHPVKVGGFRRSERERRLGHALVGAAEGAACDVTIGVRHLPRVDLYWPHGGAHRRSFEARRESRGRTPGIARGRHRVFLDFERQLCEGGGARRIVCVSDLVRRELAELYPACASRLHVVPNGVDLRLGRDHEERRWSWRKRHRIGEQEVLLVFAARDPVLKGLAALLRALGQVRTPVRWRLLVAGGARAGTWGRRAQKLGVPFERLLFLEEVRSEDLFAAGDVCVLPTWRDPFPLVVLEALAAGRPALVSGRAGCAPLVADARVGSVVEQPDDTPGWSCALEHWIEVVARGEVDSEAIRSRVGDLDQARWLEAMELQVRAAYGERAGGR